MLPYFLYYFWGTRIGKNTGQKFIFSVIVSLVVVKENVKLERYKIEKEKQHPSYDMNNIFTRQLPCIMFCAMYVFCISIFIAYHPNPKTVYHFFSEAFFIEIESKTAFFIFFFIFHFVFFLFCRRKNRFDLGL